MADEHFEYLVIGGGSGGMASARRAAAHGAKVAVVERDRLGGTCVNLGCVPKKVMFNAATIQEMIHQAAGYGFTVGDVSFDLASLKAKRDAYVKRLNGIYAGNLEKSGITSITGDACFVGPKEVRVGDKTYSGDHVLIAVGGKPTMPEIPGIELAIDSNGFFDLEAVPKRCAVIGSGYIAVELAGILQLLGSKVDLVIRGDRPLRNMEKDVVDLRVDEMKGCGVTLVQGEVASLKGSANGGGGNGGKGGGKGGKGGGGRLPTHSPKAIHEAILSEFGPCQTARGLSIRPRPGDVVLFYNTRPNSVEADYWPWHGSCEVTHGEKWAANLWFHATTPPAAMQ